MSVVYFLQVTPDGAIKIGTTNGHVAMRVRALQHGSPHILKWIGYFEGDRSDEHAAHKLLRGSRMRGEWFYPTSEVLAFVQEKCPVFDEARAVAVAFHDDVRVAVQKFLPAYRKDRPERDALCRAAGISTYDLSAWMERIRIPTQEQVDAMTEFMDQARIGSTSA